MTERTSLRADLAQALADLAHLRQLVSDRKVNAAALAVGENRVAGLRRRVAALAATTGEDTRGGGVVS